MLTEVPRETFSEPETTALVAITEENSVDVPVEALQQTIVPASHLILPVTDVRRYLAERKDRRPVAHWTEEEALFCRLPDKIKEDVKRLLGLAPGQGAFGRVARHIAEGWSAWEAVAEACTFKKLSRSVKTNYGLFKAWQAKGDWLAVVNRAKAGGEWQDRDDGLPVDFLKFCQLKLGEYNRDDAKRQAVLSIQRQWETGLNEDGEREPIPGFGDIPVQFGDVQLRGGYWQDWYRQQHPGERLPEQAPALPGGSYSNISEQIKKANLFPKVVQKLIQEGEAAAREFLPLSSFDRNRGGADGGPLRFLEIVVFDDVRCDFLVFDPITGKACDLWLLIARDLATGMILGFGVRPATTREDGTQMHLRQQDMKQIAGLVLERWGIPPYLVTWRLERGTATLPLAYSHALAEMIPGSIKVNHTGMLGGKSARGYNERKTGNARAKGSLESQHRLQHTAGSYIPGQIGRNYGKRPADVIAQAEESEEIWKNLTQHLPEDVRNQVGYTVLTIAEAREHLLRIFDAQNARTKHELQGFATVIEWYDAGPGRWRPRSTCPDPRNVELRKRLESPYERCARLVMPYRHQWRSVSPEVIRALYVHTMRDAPVQKNGLIKFRIEGTEYEFKPAPGCAPQQPGTKLLAYCNTDDPRFLYVTNGAGSIVGIWIRKDYAYDRQTLDDAIHYTQSALKAAKEVAAEITSPQRAKLEAIRADNEVLHAAHTFTAVTTTAAPKTKQAESPLAHGLARVGRVRQQQKDATAEAKNLAEQFDQA